MAATFLSPPRLDRLSARPHPPRSTVEPLIDLAPGAENNPLAARFAERIRQRVREDPPSARSFAALKSTILVVPFDTGDALTLRFDLGRLVIHDGNIGIPSVTFGGPTDALVRLEDLQLPGFREILKGRALSPSLREAMRVFASRDVKIYGLWVHPRTIYRFLRLLSSAAPIFERSP
jgi:hypothetical protein